VRGVQLRIEATPTSFFCLDSKTNEYGLKVDVKAVTDVAAR
jgi:hypothetical protein